MALFDWFKRTKAGSFDLNSPEFYEMIRSGTPLDLHVTPDKAMRLSAVFACVKVLSETIASLPCELFSVDPEGNEFVSRKDRLYRLIRSSPNDWQTAQEWWMLQVVNLCLRGNSYNYIVWDENQRPVSIMPLPVDAVSVDVQHQNRIIYEVTIGISGQTRTMRMSQHEVLHFKGMSVDGIVGVSPIKYNSALIGGAIQARDHASKVFTNDATPRGVLEVEGTLDDKTHQRMKESWNEIHQGPSNAHKVAILEAGTKFKGISLSPDDVQLLDTRQLSRQEIASIFRIPPHMVGDLSRSSHSNIEHLGHEFLKSTIRPWLINFEQRLGLQLLGNTSRRFSFDVTELIRGDFEKEVKSYTSLIERGVYSPDEVRKRFGMNPRPDGRGNEYVLVENLKPRSTTGDDERPDTHEERNPDDGESNA